MTSNSSKRTAWAWTIATFFGVGRLKPGPGTWGSLAALLIWWLVATRLQAGPLVAETIALCVMATALGILACNVVVAESGISDPTYAVIDEAAGQWLALLGAIMVQPVHALPHTVAADTWLALSAFVLFRLFDIAKPWPIRKLERLPAGWGIMLDDLGAGIYALAGVLIIRHFIA
jgi:phosphatidylglycerophosphatase A